MHANVAPEDQGFVNFVTTVLSRVVAFQFPNEGVDNVGHATSLLVKELSVRENYVLFDARDLSSWLIFLLVFILLTAFDNFVLHRNPQAILCAFRCEGPLVLAHLLASVHPADCLQQLCAAQEPTGDTMCFSMRGTSRLGSSSC